MELDMPITRVLLKAGCSNFSGQQQSLTVQPAQVLGSNSQLPTQLSSPTKTTKVQENNKYKMSVARRNERERRRVQHVNRTFDTLRQHVQGYKNANKKMSKVETLRCAVEYIRELQTILGLSEENGVLSPLDTKTSRFEYQMPATPTSPEMQTSFDYSQSPQSEISSPAHSPRTSSESTTTILAERLQMPPIQIKQEPTEEYPTPEVTPDIVFDFNGNSAMESEHLLDEQSYRKLAAALQQHGDQLSLQFNPYALH
ncbi:uncharacterized protein LOC108864462 [Galendromus occidentalis]|uniref:Uncharacterized protein LOC108864462 n=1 Tax=Galendromus occidentalis TaxID=34638 RepID=A0AAJ7L4N7_9ACAR|nr:uncharacterized protein LOC108864462 [Galendromus occidentalis]